MKAKSLRTLCAVALLLACCAAGRASELDRFKGEQGELTLAGAPAHLPVLQEAARRIMAANPEIRISLAGGGSELGIQQAAAGLVNLGNSGRAPSEQEIAAYGLILFKWADDGVAIVVNPANPVRALSEEQAIGIFTGKIASWQEAGGSQREHINVYTRDTASSICRVFRQKALKQGKIMIGAGLVDSNRAMKTAISQDPYGIGYIPMRQLDETVAPVAFNLVMPSRQTVQTGKYPIVRGLYSVSRGEPFGLTRKFLDYLFSYEGQKIVAEKGFTPVRVLEISDPPLHRLPERDLTR